MSARIAGGLAAAAALVFFPTVGPSAEPVRVTAEALAKECKAGPDRAEARYKGKVLRVTGVVGDIYDDILYLKAGGGATVGIRYGKGNKPPIKSGETATFEGTFDRVAVLGPALTGCKLVLAPGAKK